MAGSRWASDAAAGLLDLRPAAPGGAPFWSYRTLGPELFRDLRDAAYRKIALQVPAGLTRNVQALAAQLRRETGADVAVVARACFGACDVPSPDEVPGAQASVVLGHARIPNVALPLPTYFVEMREPGGDAAKLAAIVDRAGLPERLALVASVQHLDLVGPLAEALRATGRTVRYDEGDRRLAYAAQALGCNYSGAERAAGDVDAFLFVGTGRFHPLGLALAVDRPVHALDPLQALLEPPIDRGALVRRRQLLVASLRDATRFAILVSSFAGQHRGGMAQALRSRAIAHGRSAEILVFGRLDPSDLVGRDVEAYVSTACPRIALDDGGLYPRPVITPPELLMALGELPIEPYRFDTFR